MVSKEKIVKYRKEAEDKILNFIREWDKTGYNESIYRDKFKKMSNADFILWMEKLRDNKEYLHYEIGNRKDIPTIDYIESVAKKYGTELCEYVVLPYRSEDPNLPMVTKTKVPIIKVTVRRLQQIVSKKNSISSDTSSVNPILGQVTGDSKSAKWSTAETCSATALGLTNINKEFLGPRSDDDVSKRQMIEQIDKYGHVSLDNLDIHAHNKQSLNTVEVFLKSVGIVTDISRDK